MDKTIASKMVTAKVDENIKDKAEKILNDLGMSRSQAINVFYRQIIQHDGLPFAVQKVHSAQKEREYLEKTGTLDKVYDLIKEAADSDFERVR